MRYLFTFFLITTSHILLGHGSHGSGVMAGVTHPIFGVDHLLAIFAMSLYAKINYRDIAWYVAISFMLGMVIGGVIGINGSPFLLEEIVIKGSMILYGLLLLLKVKIPVRVFLGLGLMIAFYHGHAHGVEMPDSTESYKYVPGFAFGAIIICAFGEFVGRHMSANEGIRARIIGGVIVAAGIYQLLA